MENTKFSKALNDMKTIVKSLFEKPKDDEKDEMLAAVKDDNGNLLIIPENGLIAGEKLDILQEDGSIIPAPDGDYFLEGQVISVMDGVITEVKPIPEEEDITEEVAEEEMAAEENEKKEFEDVAGEADLTELRENMNEIVGMMQEVVQFITTLDERVMRLEARSEATEQYTALMQRIEKLEETPMAESIKKNKNKINVEETEDKYIMKLRNLRNK